MDTIITCAGLARVASVAAALPLWVSGLLIVVGLPVLVAVVQAVIRRRFPVLLERRHNDVTGFLLAVIGVIYAVSAGFILLDLHDNYRETREATRAEALTLLTVAQASRVMGEEARRRVTERVLDYERATVASWPPGTGDEETVTRALDRLFDEIAALRPAGEAQKTFVRTATARLMEVDRQREELRLEAERGYLEPVLWLAMIVASAATLGFCLLFGLEQARLHYLLVGGVAVVVAVNFFLMVQLDHPFSGGLSVGPDVHRYVIRELTR